MKKLLLLFAMLTVLVFASPPAQAHDASLYYNQEWLTYHNVNVHIVDDGSSWWTTAVRADILHAVTQWNLLSNSTGPHYVIGSDWGSGAWKTCPNMSTWDVEIRRTTSITNLATGNNCGDLATSGQVQINSDPKYHNGTDNLDWYRADCGGGQGPQQVSLCGVLTHEFGHVSGSLGPTNADPGAFPDSAAICIAPGIHTMCSGVAWEYTGDYTQWFQASTLETHDQHTFENAYA